MDYHKKKNIKIQNPIISQQLEKKYIKDKKIQMSYYVNGIQLQKLQ